MTTADRIARTASRHWLAERGGGIVELTRCDMKPRGSHAPAPAYPVQPGIAR
jgi:hypothetical protein